jgi:hypothetical protein
MVYFRRGRRCTLKSVFTNAPVKKHRSVQVDIGASCVDKKGLSLIRTHEQRVLPNDDGDGDDDHTAAADEQSHSITTAVKKTTRLHWVSKSYDKIRENFEQMKIIDAMLAGSKSVQNSSLFQRCTVRIPAQ